MNFQNFINDWRFFALASAVFASMTAIFGKMGVADINSNLATFIRTVVILLVTAGMVSLQKGWQAPSEINMKSLLFLILSGVATGGSWLCYFHALKLGPVSRVAPIDKLSVALVIVLSILFLGEKASFKVLFGGALIVGGSIILALP